MHELPPDLRLATHDEIDLVVGAILDKLDTVSTHNEAPMPAMPDIPIELVRQFIANRARATGMSEEQVLNTPHHPLVELQPVEDLTRLAIRHFGFEAGMPPNFNVATVARAFTGDDGVPRSAHIQEEGGNLKMLMDDRVLVTEVPDHPVGININDSVRPATVADCLEITRQIRLSPDSRY